MKEKRSQLWQNCSSRKQDQVVTKIRGAHKSQTVVIIGQKTWIAMYDFASKKPVRVEIKKRSKRVSRKTIGLKLEHRDEYLSDCVKDLLQNQRDDDDNSTDSGDGPGGCLVKLPRRWHGGSSTSVSASVVRCHSHTHTHTHKPQKKGERWHLCENLKRTQQLELLLFTEFRFDLGLRGFCDFVPPSPETHLQQHKWFGFFVSLSFYNV